MERLPPLPHSIGVDHLIRAAGQSAGHGCDSEPWHFLMALCEFCASDWSAYPAGKGSEQLPGAEEPEAAELREIFGYSGIDRVALWQQTAVLCRARRRPPTHPDGTAHRSEAARDLFRAAQRFCRQHQQPYLRPVHLLWALAGLEGSQWQQSLPTWSVKAAAVARVAGFSGRMAMLDAEDEPPSTRMASGIAEAFGLAAEQRARLASLGRDLTALAAAGELPSRAERRHELNRLGLALQRGEGSSILLVGAPGSGRSALVAGLASRIVEGRAANCLRDLRLLELAPARLMELSPEDREQVLETAEASRTVPFVTPLDERGDRDPAGEAALALLLARPRLSWIASLTPARWEEWEARLGSSPRCQPIFLSPQQG